MSTSHGLKRRALLPGLWLAAGLLPGLCLGGVWAGESGGPPALPLETPPSYPNSPYHGQIDGDGNVIPCRCRFRGERVMLGAVVCMETHIGTVLTRCDLRDGNTAWVPSNSPCNTSEAPAQVRSLAARTR